MVPISHGAAVPENDGLIVYADDGQYAETDLILCAKVTDPSFPVSMFQAQFVKYGSIVYQFNTPEDLGQAIFAIDPDSTLDAVALYKEQVARDAARAAGTLTPDNPVPTPDSPDPADPPPDIPSDPEPEVPQTPPDTPPVDQATLDQQLKDLETSLGNGTSTATTSDPALIDPTTAPGVNDPNSVSQVLGTSTTTDSSVGNVSSTTPTIDAATTTPS